MKIIRDPETFQILLQPYKINIKEIKNKHSKSYQYTCILPPFLCDLFNINKEENIEDRSITFYNYQKDTYITSTNNFFEISAISLQRKQLEDMIKIHQKNNTNIPEDLQKEYNNLLVNYSVYDNITDKVFTTAYNLSKSNSFRITLPNRLFKDKIILNQDNYILFTIDTLTKDFTNNYGVVKVDVLQELKEDV